MNSNLLPIAKEGWQNIFYLSLSFLFFTLFDLDFLSFISFGLLLFLFYSYRNPEREITLFEKDSVVSPVDGYVVSISDMVDSEYALKVVLYSGYGNVGVLRAPMNAKIVQQQLTFGAKLAGEDRLANKLNESAVLVFEDEKLNHVKVKHLSNRSLTKISINTIKNQSLLQTTRYGFASSGITTLYLPKNFRLNLRVGNEVSASQTLVGYFS